MRSITASVFAFACLFLAGCNFGGIGRVLPGPTTAISIQPQDQRELRLRGDFDRAYYDFDDDHTVTIVLLKGEDEAPEQAAVIRLFWRATAGSTPLEPTATNATIHYLIFAEADTERGELREVGVYSGAGFLNLSGKPGPSRLVGNLWDGELSLDDRSANFNDLLGPSTIEGSFTARREPQRVQSVLRRLASSASQRLGYPRLVQVENDASRS